MPIHRSGPCSITCPNGGGCIYWRDTEECDCFCNDDQIHLTRQASITFETRVDFFAQALRLSDLASRLAKLLPVDISIFEVPPNEIVDIELANVSILEVLQAVGLSQSNNANYYLQE